jgi:hypothetical protein
MGVFYTEQAFSAATSVFVVRVAIIPNLDDQGYVLGRWTKIQRRTER